MTVRLRLTLLYGVLFLISGAVLLGITYLLVAHGGGTLTMSQRSSLTGGQETVTTRIIQQFGAEQQASMLHQLLVKSGIALGIMAVLAGFLGWLVAGRVLRPLQTMTERLRTISARNVHERLAVAGPRDELKSLADTVDGLLGRLEAAIESHKRFVANAAHELRTPLTLEHALLEEAVLDPAATAEVFRAQFAELMVVSEQQARLLDSLLVLATSERGLDRRADVELSTLAGDVVKAARPEVVVEADLRPAPVTGDPALVERLVANLVDNALSYNVPGGRVEVVTGVDADRSFLEVVNTGPRVPPEMVDRLLSPFQRLDRTARDDGHHGLGLSIVQSIATAHEAELTVRARADGGLAVRVVFVPVV